MIDSRLRIVILVFLWGALIEDVIIFGLAWLAPDVWFRLLHDSLPAGLETALVRRSAGQWAAFALAQGITLWRWQKHPVWLPVCAGVRFSDLFTDLSYLVAAPGLTTIGWIALVPLPFLNLVGVVIMLWGYKQMARSRRREQSTAGSSGSVQGDSFSRLY